MLLRRDSGIDRRHRGRSRRWEDARHRRTKVAREEAFRAVAQEPLVAEPVDHEQDRLLRRYLRALERAQFRIRRAPTVLSRERGHEVRDTAADIVGRDHLHGTLNFCAPLYVFLVNTLGQDILSALYFFLTKTLHIQSLHARVLLCPLVHANPK